MTDRVTLNVISLSQDLENRIRNNLSEGDSGKFINFLESEKLNIFSQISEKIELATLHGYKNVPIVCKPDIRLYFRRLIEKKFPRIKVLSYLEISPEYKLAIIFTING